MSRTSANRDRAIEFLINTCAVTAEDLKELDAQAIQVLYNEVSRIITLIKSRPLVDQNVILCPVCKNSFTCKNFQPLEDD